MQKKQKNNEGWDGNDFLKMSLVTEWGINRNAYKK